MDPDKDPIIKKWNELIDELDIYLQIVRKRGGTMGHKVGNIKDDQIRIKKLFEEIL